jgi:hypothetical protein
MFQIDIKDLRALRQIENYNLVLESNFDTKNINTKALERTCSFLNMTKEELLSKASKDKEFQKLFAMMLAKNSSRQGTRDESLIVNGVSREMKRHGINIRNYTTNEKVPIRESSDVLPRVQAKRRFDTDLLMKSFDFGGQVCDNRRIEGFAKVCIGAGGHQDNVYHEASEFLKWASEYGSETTVYTVLMDTDQDKIFNNLKELENKLGKQNLWVVNHRQLQERLVSLKNEN